MSKHQLLYLAIAIVVVLAIIFLIVSAARRRHSGQLRNQFGPEYDRTLQTAGNRRTAEAELASRAERRKSFEVRPLDPASRDRYQQQWLGVQAGFVDAPAQSVRQADALVTQLMTERGYPMVEFDQRSADVSVDHPREVEDYRRAHAISRANDDNKATTEDLRQAMTHYRSLFDGLLHDGEGGSAEGDGTSGDSGQRERENAELPGRGAAGQSYQGAAGQGQSQGYQGQGQGYQSGPVESAPGEQTAFRGEAGNLEQPRGGERLPEGPR